MLKITDFDIKDKQAGLDEHEELQRKTLFAKLKSIIFKIEMLEKYKQYEYINKIIKIFSI